MTIELNHTIVESRDPRAAARWWSETFGLASPIRVGTFWQVRSSNGVDFDFARRDAVAGQHYAFLVTDEVFEAVFARLVERGDDYYADPARHRKGEMNHNDGGRGIYFSDPDGHLLEILTRPYGSGPA